MQIDRRQSDAFLTRLHQTSAAMGNGGPTVCTHTAIRDKDKAEIKNSLFAEVLCFCCSVLEGVVSAASPRPSPCASAEHHNIECYSMRDEFFKKI